MIFLALVSTFFVGDGTSEVKKAEERLLGASEAAWAKVQLAKALWQDQNQENAFRIFNEALDEARIEKGPPLSKAEEEKYQEALKLYLGHPPAEGREIAKKLMGTYEPYLKAHPEWFRLGFIVATAQANLLEFERFFEQFYQSYKQDPDHFLAHKTRAILHIKLYERAKNFEERAKQRELILKYLQQAERIHPADFSLYTIQVAFASPEQKEKLKQEVLNKILLSSMIPSRVETLFFLKMALSTKNKDLQNRWFEKASSWYPDSRSIKQLKDEQNGHENAR